MINEPLKTHQREGGNNSSVILLRKECFEKMFTNLTDTYGAPGYSMIFSMGKNVGQEEFKSIAENQNQLDIPMTRPKILKKVLERLTSMGWGGFQVESLELNASAIVVVQNNIFSYTCSENSVGCCFLQGIISGLMSEVFESEPIYGEPRCQKEETGRCVFKLTSKNAHNKLF